jgi:hypothetical protein
MKTKLNLGLSDITYIIEDSILEQKDYRIDSNQTILDFINSDDVDLIDPFETVILLSFDGKIFEMNLSASLIWELIKSGSTANHINEILKEIFVDEHSYFDDIKDFIMKLQGLGFLKVE